MRLLQRIAIAFVALFVVLPAAWVASRWHGPTRAQREAVALMAQTETFAGRNGFADLWLLPYEVPDAERQEVLDADVRAFAGRETDPASGAPWAFTSTAAGRYPERRLDSRERGLVQACLGEGADCLGAVTSRPDDYRALVEATGPLRRRAGEVALADHLASPFPKRLSAPMPSSLESLALPRVQAALAFSQGRRAHAMAGVCASVQRWQRLRSAADSPFAAAIAGSQANADARLLADMLAAYPAGAELPAPCTELEDGEGLAEPTGCPAARGEFAVASDNVRSVIGSRIRGARRLMFDEEMTVALVAEALAPYCGEAARRALAADSAMEMPDGRSPWRVECVSNPAGCMVYRTVATYGNSLRDLQDGEAQIGLVRIALWLHRQPGAADAARAAELVPARLPGPLRMAARRELRVDEADGRLVVQRQGRGTEPTWSIPLPASRTAAE